MFENRVAKKASHTVRLHGFSLFNLRKKYINGNTQKETRGSKAPQSSPTFLSISLRQQPPACARPPPRPHKLRGGNGYSHFLTRLGILTAWDSFFGGRGRCCFSRPAEVAGPRCSAELGAARTAASHTPVSPGLRGPHRPPPGSSGARPQPLRRGLGRVPAPGRRLAAGRAPPPPPARPPPEEQAAATAGCCGNGSRRAAAAAVRGRRRRRWWGGGGEGG